MARRQPPPPPAPPLALTVPRSEAHTKLGQQIEKGRVLLSIDFRSEDQLKAARSEQAKWSDYTQELLARTFTNRMPAAEFLSAGYAVIVPSSTFAVVVNQFRGEVERQITRLESIVQRLELIPEATATGRSVEASPSKRAQHTRKVFVVHGHDDAARETVCRFLERLELQPVVLHEQASKGMTVIEKIEANSDVEFAVVLMTADDVGTVKSAREDLRLRARQNVVLELGYFLAKIGRSRVCALYQHGVELPSDFAGVVYVSLAGPWQFELAKEIKAASIEVDFNLL